MADDMQALERTRVRKIHVQAPEPDLTPEEAIARAAALRPMLRAQQDEADALGHYTVEAHEAIKAAGLYRLLQPRMFGGYEFDYPTFLRVVIEIGRGHPGAAWCFCLAASHALVVGAHFPEEVQAELFGPEGDFRAPHRAPPSGRFTPVEGGYRVSGRWSYSSGIPHATHFIGGGLIEREGAPPQPVNFITPRANVTVVRDWGDGASLGMEASGSNTVELKDVFVPERHVFSEDILLTSEGFSGHTGRGAEIHGNPIYLGVVGGFFHATFGAIYTGAARAALDEFEETARNTTPFRQAGAGTRLNDPDAQGPFGRALNLTDSAEALTLAVGRMFEEQCARAVETGEPVTVADTMKLWSIAREATMLACDAIELLFRTSPVRAANRGQKMQRYLRDVQMYRIHPSSQPWLDQGRARAEWGLPIGRFGR